MNLTVACYIRVSTDDQTHDSQRLAIGRWLEQHCIPEGRIRWYADTESRDHLNRPKLRELQRDVAAGKVGTILVYKLDRISGSMHDGLMVLRDWLDRGIRFVAVSQNFDYSGTIGQMIAALLFGLSQMEQETRRDRQRLGIEAAKRKGVYTGRKPGSTKAEPAPALELRERNLSVPEIAAILDCSSRTVRRYFRLRVLPTERPSDSVSEVTAGGACIPCAFVGAACRL